MRTTQQFDTSFVFTSALIIVITVLILLTFPLFQSVLEVINKSVSEFLGAFNTEISRSLGR